MISNYETPIWAKNGWLVNLTPQLTADTSYDVGDLLKPIANALTYKGGLYSVPFYGESSMVYYRKDLFKKAGLTMPLHPTWVQIAAFAKKLNTPNTAGICLRGQAGWGENLAALDTVINTAGGSWFNAKWQPQLTSSADEARDELLCQPRPQVRRAGRVQRRLHRVRGGVRRRARPRCGTTRPSRRADCDGISEGLRQHGLRVRADRSPSGAPGSRPGGCTPGR